MSYEDLIQIPSFLASSIKQALTSSSSSSSTYHVCDSSCQLRCEKAAQCSGCQGVCEDPCMAYCQSTCETSSQCDCQDGEGCMGGLCGQCACEDGCQDCESSCEGACQSCMTQAEQTVTCTKIAYFYDRDKSTLLSTSTETESGLVPGFTFTPSDHCPSYNSHQYTLYRVVYNGITLGGGMTCPSSNFTVYYYFYYTAIDLWSWTSSNGDASNDETSAAYYVITHNGRVAGFSYLVWNDLAAKIMEAINAADTQWNDTYATYDETLMTANDKVLTAKRFNSLRYNVGRRVSTGIDDVSKGDPVIGEYFVTITNSLNTWIESING